MKRTLAKLNLHPIRIVVNPALCMNPYIKDPSKKSFWGIEKYKKDWRGNDKIKSLSKAEPKWIYELKTLEPNRLNVDFDVNCFRIRNY